jgi:hypothetical protein
MVRAKQHSHRSAQKLPLPPTAGRDCIGAADPHHAAMRTAATTLAMLAALPLAGCCTMARFFCGPDRTPWVSVDYSTPEATVRTLLEALRREVPEIVYECLADAYAQQLGVDQMTVQLAWPRIVEQNPGLHVAGYAEVPMAQRTGPDTATVELAIEGRPVTIELVRQARWQARFEALVESPDAPPRWLAIERAKALPSWAAALQLAPADEMRSTLAVPPTEVRHDGIDELTAAQVTAFGLQRLWKVRALGLTR